MSKVLFVGGGTLGSVNPLLAVAKELIRQRSNSILIFWGSANKLDRQVVEESKIPFQSIPAGKFRRYFSFWTFVDVFIVAWAFIIALVKLQHLRPKIIVTAGSYVAVPVAWAAWILQIPVLLYQQDSTIGLANKLISNVVKIRTATTEQAARLLKAPVEIVGFSLRPDLSNGNKELAASKYGLSTRQPTILVIGGSSGALSMNQKFAESLLFLDTQIQVVHITGTGKEINFNRSGYIQIPFTNEDLPDLYALATLVVSRAGSNVLAELIALRKPMVVIPLPNTHQVQNAMILEEHGIMVRDQKNLTGESLAKDLNSLLTDKEKLQKLSQATVDLWSTDGAQNLVRIISQYI